MNCTNCGHPLGEGDKFCMKCGTPVASQAPAPAPGPVTAPAAPVPDLNANPNAIPYIEPVMEGGNINIPMARKYRIRCPDCGKVSDVIKRDNTVGFPCPACTKAYAYGGQVLIYRMGNGLPSCHLMPVDILIDGIEYGEIVNCESIRIMLPAGQHVIGMRSRPAWPYSGVLSNQFQIVIGPQSYNLAFKLSITYRYMASNGLELNQCAPQEIPDI